MRTGRISSSIASLYGVGANREYEKEDNPDKIVVRRENGNEVAKNHRRNY